MSSDSSMVLAQMDSPVNSTPVQFTLALKRLHARRPAYILAPGETTIGSAAECSLRLEAPGVADVHCVIHSSQGHSELQAHDRRTWLNGYLTTGSRLQHGDLIDIGPIQFCVQRIPVDTSQSVAKRPAAFGPPVVKPKADSRPSRPTRTVTPNPRPEHLSAWQPTPETATRLLKQDVLRLQNQFHKLHRQQQDLRLRESALADRTSMQQTRAQELDALQYRLSDWQRNLESREQQFAPSAVPDPAVASHGQQQSDQHDGHEQRLQGRSRQLQRQANEMAEQQLQVNQQLMVIANRNLELDELEKRRRGEHTARLEEIARLQDLHDQRTADLQAHTQDLDKQRQHITAEQRRIEQHAQELERLKQDLDRHQ